VVNASIASFDRSSFALIRLLVFTVIFFTNIKMSRANPAKVGEAKLRS
jgi:hypothetical protein